jgi:hypothetical protein
VQIIWWYLDVNGGSATPLAARDPHGAELVERAHRTIDVILELVQRCRDAAKSGLDLFNLWRNPVFDDLGDRRDIGRGPADQIGNGERRQPHPADDHQEWPHSNQS